MASRNLNGIFAVYKPAGVTSADVTNCIKYVISCGQQTPKLNPSRRQSVKVGHGGTLDFDATGILVVGVGSGTKELGTYLQGKKKYTAVGLLGTGTNTHSMNGEVTERSSYEHITNEKFLAALSKYHGQILQTPPIYSALKFRGHTMASLAAAGFPVSPKPARMVTVEYIRCTSYKPPEFTLEISCGGGFYVRKLIHDLGKDLGSCACMKSLERTQQGPFILGGDILKKQDWTLDKIKEAIDSVELPER